MISVWLPEGGVLVFIDGLNKGQKVGCRLVRLARSCG